MWVTQDSSNPHTLPPPSLPAPPAPAPPAPAPVPLRLCVTHLDILPHFVGCLQPEQVEVAQQVVAGAQELQVQLGQRQGGLARVVGCRGWGQRGSIAAKCVCEATEMTQ